MREMCHNEAEMSPSTPDVGQSEANATSATASAGADPFYDRFPWFRLVGRAYVYLSNLMYPVPLIHRLAVVNDKGDVKGYVRVAVQAILDEETVDYPMGIRQSATISFPDDVASSLTEKEGRKGFGSDEESDGEPTDVADINEKEIDTQDEKQETFDDLPSHLKIGQEFTMRVTVLQAYGIASEYSDIFTQFK